MNKYWHCWSKYSEVNGTIDHIEKVQVQLTVIFSKAVICYEY